MTQRQLAEIYKKASYLPIGRRRERGVVLLGILRQDLEPGQEAGIQQNTYIYEDTLYQQKEEQKRKQKHKDTEDMEYPQYMATGENLVKLDMGFEMSERRRRKLAAGRYR